MRIDKGVEIPRRARGQWDFVDEMEPGDSILFDNQQEQLRCRDALRYRKMKYKTAMTNEGYRVWFIGD